MLNRKHIRAPRSFDPGPGLPRERLAYLSDDEMEMLRVLTDGTISRGPHGIPSFAVTSGTTSGTTMSSGGGSSSTGGGGMSQSQLDAYREYYASRAAAASASSKSPTTSSNLGGGSKGTASAPASSSSTSTTSRGPSDALSAPARTAPSAASSTSSKTPSSPMGGQGTSFSSPQAASSYNKSVSAAAGAAAKAYNSPSSPMGGQGSSFSSPVAASSFNRDVSGSLNAGKNPSGSSSSRTASAMSKSQVDAYKTFGAKMAAAPTQPGVPRSQGDAAQLARMAQAESGLIRDPVTGKMSMLGAEAVMDVIRNRMEQQGLDVNGIISQKAQFTPWGNGSFASTPADPAYEKLAEQVLRGVTPDYTLGANYYHNPSTVNGGYSQASATTKNRTNNNFKETLNVADAMKPGVWGHSFGISADGSIPTRVGSVPMGAPRRGQTNYGTGVPANVPQGALSQDPNYGGFVGSTGITTPSDISSVPGRFGGLRPGFTGPISRVSDIDISTLPASSPEAARFATAYQPDRWEQDVGFLAGRTVPPTAEEAALAGYSNPYSAVDPRLIEGAAQMIRDAEAATGATAQINDAYRSYWHQAAGSPPEPGKKAKPGNSWHQAGTAIDLAAGPVRSYLLSNRGSLPSQYGMVKPENLMDTDLPHFQVAGLTRPFENSAVKSGINPPGGGYTVDGFAPSQEPANFPSSYALSEGGIYNALKNVPGAISGLGQGIRSLSETLSTPNPTFKGFAGTITSTNPIVRAAAQGIAGQVIGPRVKEAAASAIQTLKDTFADRDVSPIGGLGGPRTYDGLSAPARTAASSGATTDAKKKYGRNPDDWKSSNSGVQREATKKPEKKKTKVGQRKIEDLAKPETPQGDPWANYMNVMSKEEALRRLLGEEWYA